MERMICLTAAVGNEWLTNLLNGIIDAGMSLALRIVLAVITFLIGSKLIKLVRKILKKALTKADVDTGVIQFLDSFAKGTLYVLLVFLIATSFGVDAASVIAVVGSAGVAVGLAIQGSLSNLAGGILLLILKPFKVGDYIKEDAAGNEGTVTEIQMFYTKLLTPDNRTIILPNGTLANTSMTNVTAADKRRLDIQVGVSYDADIRAAKAVLTNILEQESDILHDMAQNVFVDNLGESAVVLGMRCWVEKSKYWDVKWRMTEAVKYALDEAGISIPYPQVDVHVKEEA
ncbi:MAG: mechanosensitive ion channel [Lachnospiraceae bacterium]|nr:mechanosensitive ion channel [Lachnospiraceae bacterium]